MWTRLLCKSVYKGKLKSCLIVWRNHRRHCNHHCYQSWPSYFPKMPRHLQDSHTGCTGASTHPWGETASTSIKYHQGLKRLFNSDNYIGTDSNAPVRQLWADFFWRGVASRDKKCEEEEKELRGKHVHSTSFLFLDFPSFLFLYLWQNRKRFLYDNCANCL